VTQEDADATNFLQSMIEAAVPDRQWQLGNYEILEEIGRGGMGVIYRARQRHSRRIVAVKRLLSYHADSNGTLARFRREAEAAASLDHPNILPIYEVGEGDDGVPYFSMRFAPGGSLQEGAIALRPQPRECVRLLAKVASAVHYAHSQGIIHRDLKPGNILLDSQGEPLISDFGLAKWLDSSSNLTRTLTIFGTPGYIAPEQAEGSAADLKATADIYSLGAILFELLSGRPPFLGEHALAVIRQAAEKPAPKLRSMTDTADGDLETICARCLERQPSARYLSARDLAEDLERWLEGRPIIARPTSLPLQAWRWSRRNPLVAGAVAVLLALLTLIGGLFDWQLRSQTESKAELAKLRQGVMEFAQVETQVCQPGEKEVREDVYFAVASQLGIDGQLLRERLPPFAAYLQKAADTSSYERANAAYVVRNYSDAERLALEAADESRKIAPGNSKPIVAALELAGLSARRAIHYDRALEHFREAEKLTDRHRNVEEWIPVQQDIADLFIVEGKYSDAEELIRTIIAVRTQLLGSEDPDTLDSRHRLIYPLNRQTRYAEAESEARQVLKLRKKVLGDNNVDTFVSRYSLADVLVEQGKFSEAEGLYREVISFTEKRLGLDHPRTLSARLGLATVLGGEGKNAEAESLYREVVKLDKKVYGSEHPNTLNDRQDLATALQAEGKYQAAETEYREVIKLETRVIGTDHPDLLALRNNLADLLDDEKDFAGAEAECRQIIGLEQKVLGPENLVTLNTRGNLAVALIGEGKFPDARSEYQDVLRLMERVLRLDHPDTVTFTEKFAMALAHQNRTAEAIQISRRMQADANKALGANDPATQKYARLVQSLEARKSE
jgi:tetratricopeptide (TPR) repeat protein/predicted Ser/Thr protein kinase